jgi:hypothetical protein
MNDDRTRTSLFAAAVVVALAMLLGGKAEAAAFCSYGSEGREQCAYHTWEQCLASVRGAGGFCMRNPHDPAAWTRQGRQP